MDRTKAAAAAASVSLCLALLLATTSNTLVQASSFHSDVVRPTRNHAFPSANRREHHHKHDHHSLKDELLAKAVPLAEYEALKLDAYGKRLYRSSTERSRRLEDHNDEDRNDDFYVDYDDMYSFSGYSMKYAHCQPVQYFSEDAIMAGEHSPMITEDIVVLRLCPHNSCSESAEYGCHYNYAEYALSLTDYLTVMLKYSAKKQDYLCDYCEACGVEYQGNNNNGDGDEEAANDEDANANDDAGRQRRRLEDGANDDVVDDDANGGANQQQNNNVDCTYVDTYCADFDNECGEEEGDDGYNYLSYEETLEYLDCEEAQLNDYAYFVRPRCDGYTGKIKMGVYYDNYCVQRTSDVTVKDLGLHFREEGFSEYYNGTCIDCSESYDEPYYDTNSALCNKLHSSSAKCSSNLLYDLFDGQADDSTECSFIESIRFGTYDEEGKLTSASSEMSWNTEITTSQKVMLGVSVAFCVAFVVYSCYLHHAMTNLLIKSLSHRELLPPSRHHSSRRSRSGSRRRTDDEDTQQEWSKKGNLV